MSKIVNENRKIRICIIATVPISIISFYGKQIDFLTDNGFDVTVITSSEKGLEKSISRKARLIIVPMTRIISPFRDLFALIQIYNCIRKGSFDIVQYSSPKAALLGSISAFICQVRVRIYLMWGIYYSGQKGFKRLFLKFFERIICFCSTHVSPDSKGNLIFAVEEKLCPLSKMSVVGNGSANGVDLERFDPQRLKSHRQVIRGHLHIPLDAVVVGFVGRLRRDKGINELVQAFIALSKKYSNIYLLLVGPQETVEGEYEPQVSLALTREKRIISVGYQELPEKYMAVMDIFVLPSYREGFGIVNIEASAMELPVISTDIPGPRDSVINGKTGFLVPVKTVFSLQETIEKLYNNPHMRYDMGVAGRQWSRSFEQKLIWQQIIAHRLSFLQNAPNTVSLKLKRFFDINLAMVSLILILPFMFIIGFCIFLTMGWPIFFIQRRPGYKGKIFNIYKFRTMANLTEKDGTLLSDSERLTVLGRLLRQTSLDELPELFNVLRGDMSLVGPRPLLMEYLALYNSEQARRHEVKPGITGWAQINGRNAISWDEKFKLDVWYVDNQSFWLDLKILWLTIMKVFKVEGINQEGQATMEKFRGDVL